MAEENSRIQVMNLFGSDPWWKHWSEVNLPEETWEMKSRLGFSYAKQSYSELFDYEGLPTQLTLDESKKNGAHFYMATKVSSSRVNDPRWSVLNHPSTYILPLNELNRIRASTIESAAIARRRLNRRLGSLDFKTIDSQSSSEEISNWIQLWKHNLSSRFPDAPLLKNPYDQIVPIWLSAKKIPEWIRLYQLNAGQINLATCWAYCYQGTMALYSPIMNPDPALLKMAPGKVMIDYMIEEAKSLGCHQLDFLRGDHEYKLDWGAYKVPLYTVYAPLTRTGQLLIESIKLRKQTG